MNPKQTKDKIDSYHKEGKITLQVAEKAKEVVDELERVLPSADGYSSGVYNSDKHVLIKRISLKHILTFYIDSYAVTYNISGGVNPTPESFKDIAKLLKG